MEQELPIFRTWYKMNFLQGIAGTLELFHRSTLAFQQIVGETTDHPVAVYQRIDQAGYKLSINERVLADTDTLMVFGLDHLVSEQEAEQGEIERPDRHRSDARPHRSTCESPHLPPAAR